MWLYLKHSLMTILLMWIFHWGKIPLQAQEITRADVEVGFQQLQGRLESSKLSEYREIPVGLYSRSFTLNFLNSAYTDGILLQGNGIAQSDQYFLSQLGLKGKFKWNISLDKVPHVYTKTARTIFSGSGSGVLEIPDDIQTRLRTLLSTDINAALPGIQFDTTAVTRLIDGSARPYEVVSRRKKVKSTLKYRLSEEIDLNVNYANEQRSGSKPLGGSFFNHQPIELIEPTDYRYSEAATSIDYAANVWNLQLGYAISTYNNKINVLEWDNPFREVDINVASSRGRIDLYPDNSTHRFTFSGGFNLPFSTRLVATLVYGIRKQNDSFIPQTINTVVETLATLPSMPSSSLNGKVENSLVNIVLSNRLLPNIWFTSGVRLLDYKNRTPSLLFTGYVLQDAYIQRTQRRSFPVNYSKREVTTGITFRYNRSLSMKCGYEREDWKRTYADAKRTSEDKYKIALFFSPLWLVSMNLSYNLSFKKAVDYDWLEIARVIFPDRLPLVKQLPQLRKFDLADRTRNRVNMLFQLFSLWDVNVTGSLGFSQDRFTKSDYGLRSNNLRDVSLDITYTHSPELVLTASTTIEAYRYALTSRQRRSSNDVANNDWGSEQKDVVNTHGASIFWSAVPDVMDLTFDFTFTNAKGKVNTEASGNPAEPGFIVKTAQNYPVVRAILRQFRTLLTYTLMEHFTPQFGYILESYSESYFNEDIMKPYMLDVDSTIPQAVYLGVRKPAYAAHFFYINLRYNL